ncbi:MAG: protein kinase [Planctomycetes bacterium]|nr:protein kinase [Planctomycetota bacterium]
METSGLSKLTTSGAMMGTLHYMPPEQLSDAASADHRADVYALGATLFHALTGEVPFRRKGRVAIMRAISLEPPEPMRAARPELPQEVEDLVHRAMAKQPEDRWPDARAMEAALVAALGRQP